jgi:hypothetical protein
MDDVEKVLSLKEELESARAEEAESLRRANHLRGMGDYPELKQAMRDVDLRHSTVCRLQSELSQRLQVTKLA